MSLTVLGVQIFSVLLGIPLVAANRITTVLDRLDGAFPPNAPNIPDITGPFTITVVARFDDIMGGCYQRLVDFGNGPASSNIYFGQVKNTSTMRLQFWIDDADDNTSQLDVSNALTDGTPDTWEAGVNATCLFWANVSSGPTYQLDVSNAITEGTTDTWEAGVDATGLLTIKKNGDELGQAKGALPPPTVRSRKFIGKSSWINGDDFIGAILGLKVVNHNDPQDFRSLELLNLPSQIVFTKFVASCYVRIDNLDGDRYNQRIFELSGGQQQNVVTFSQYSNTTDVVLEIRQDNLVHQCPTTSGASLVLGEMALWRVQVESIETTSFYRIEKNGVQLVECQLFQASPKVAIRQNLLIGESGCPSSTKTQGVILGLRIDDGVWVVLPFDSRKYCLNL